MLCSTGIRTAQNYGGQAGNCAELLDKLFKQTMFLFGEVG